MASINPEKSTFDNIKLQKLIKKMQKSQSKAH